ncbi:MAG: futalosine hydrolase [Solidesulfovibrio sp.]
MATAKEYRAALSPLGAPPAPAPGKAVSWRRGGRDYLAVITGVGPVAAALSLGSILGRHEGGLSGVINCGIAGSFDPAKAPLGSLVVATAEAFPEYGLRTEADTDARAIAFPQLTVDETPVFDHLPLDPEAAATAMGLSLPGDATRGACVTVAGVTASVPRAAILAEKYGAVAESMEGFAVALAAATAGLPFLEVRTISNRVGSRPPSDWDLPGALTALGQAVGRLLA